MVGDSTSSLPGYISGLLAEEGHYDEMLGVPDHPRFNEDEEREEEEEEKPGEVSGELEIITFYS